MNKTIVSFVNATIRHAARSESVVKGLTLKIEPDEAWAITGPLGSGKTTILDTIRGKNWVEPSSPTYPFLEKKVWPSDVIKILDAKVTVTGNSAYYSERYHSRREEDSKLCDWLMADQGNESAAGGGRTESIMEVARELNLVDLLGASTMNLSNGQAKRATIARALLRRPKVLLLDEPYVGLDVGARESLNTVLGNLYSSGTTKLVLAVRPMDSVPAWITHILWLYQDGTTRYVGPAPKILPRLQADLAEKTALIKLQRDSHCVRPGEVLVDLKKVSVAYWGKPVLSRVDWTIRAGEKWLLSGSNGSGKTTLLAMILGDHPKSYANEIYLFGRQRTTRDGRSVFELQREMGHSSPELHKHFPLYRTGRQCIHSAFGDSFRPPAQLSEQEHCRCDEIVEYFNLQGDLDVPLTNLSPAKQRLFLLVRALVKRPKLVILDEPFAGMDETMILRAKQYIDEEIRDGQAVLFVTHYEDETPASVTRKLSLHKGEVVEMV